MNIIQGVPVWGDPVDDGAKMVDLSELVTHWAVLDEVIKVLETATRLGSEKDEPEGNRYIQVSDTLARFMAEKLKDVRYGKALKLPEWDRTPPTQEGWYWVYFPEDTDPGGIEICLRVGFDEQGKPCDVGNYDDPWILDNVSLWLGPLPVPEPPAGVQSKLD